MTMVSICSQFVVKLVFIYFTICNVNISGVIFTKNISLNKKQYSLLGSEIIVEGVTLDYFARIPYAMPPINKLRFKHPQEFVGDPWIGIYNSTVQPNTCWQADGSEFDKLNPAVKLWLTNTNMSEDCLYLTIWSPKINKAKLPVMVWIYGGSFFSGSSTLEVYDGSILAAKHEVVVVSLQYRLGPLGFLYFDDILAPGNQGLMDQLMALKWIKNNIHNFNGDSNSVTIFGESAGSVSVSLHLLSPLSKNYFNRAIMESATAVASWAVETKNESKEKGILLSKFVDCNYDQQINDRIIRCLQNVSPDQLVAKQFDLKTFTNKQRTDLLISRGVKHLYTDASFFFDIFFRPIYDNFFIPNSIDRLMNESKSNSKVEILLGYNANEGMFFLLYGLNKWLNFFNKDKVQDTSMLSSDTPNYTKVSNFILENLATNDMAYSNLLPLLLYEYKIPSTITGWKKWNSTQVLSALDQLTGDQQFVCSVIDYAEIMADNNFKVYMYSFQHRTTRTTFPKWTGTMHGYEIEYVFGMPFSEKFQKLFYSFTEDEKKLSEYTMKMWANFAKYGNPTINKIDYFGSSVSWPLYNTTNKLSFFFTTPQDTSLTPVKINDKSMKCKFWNKVIPSITSMFEKVKNMSPSLNEMVWTNIMIILLSVWITVNIL